MSHTGPVIHECVCLVPTCILCFFSNPFCGWGGFFTSGSEEDPSKVIAFFIQASYATTATTIVSDKILTYTCTATTIVSGTIHKLTYQPA